MFKSNRGGLTGRRSGGTVTVIEEPVRRSAVRKAKIVFWILWITIGLLAATVLASKWHPILALLAGMAIGLVAAAVIAALVIAWPVLRALWWWTPEIGLSLGLVTGWVDLADHTTLPIRLAVVVSIVGIPAAIPQVRRRVVATVWCLITRHRIRTCFAEFIITNRTGSLPFLLLTLPTSVGERAWIWLRPGLALSDIQDRLDLIAVACWADTAIAESASASNSALIRLDIKRRDALTGAIASPLLGLVKPGTPPRDRDHDDLPVPTALDLPDVTAADITPPPRPAPLTRADRKTPAPTPAPPGVDPDVADYL